MTQTTMNLKPGKYLVLDAITDANETAASCEIIPLEMVISANWTAADRVTVTDPAQIRALYDNPTATSYGEGSYTVEIAAVNKTYTATIDTPNGLRTISVTDAELDSQPQDHIAPLLRQDQRDGVPVSDAMIANAYFSEFGDPYAA